MPHLKLEYSEPLVTNDLYGFAERLHQTLASIGEIRLENCKTRWQAVPDFVVGLDRHDLFVHLSIRFLDGRKKAVRRKIGKAALDLLRAHFHPPDGAACQYTVEVGEIDPDMYFKHPGGTLSTDAPDGDEDDDASG